MSSKKASGRVTSSLVALSSAAILSVYTAGYIRTQPSEAALTPAPATAARAAAAPPTLVPRALTAAPAATPGGLTARPTASAPPPVPSAPAARSAPSSVSGLPSAATSKYRDGTYVASGTSRHGSIQATVVIAGGKIVSADISRCGTRYPCSEVASLPPQVLAKQAPPVSMVSGATDSSRAYTQAISSALAQAL